MEYVFVSLSVLVVGADANVRDRLSVHFPLCIEQEPDIRIGGYPGILARMDM